MYKIGDIFKDDAEYESRASWAVQNNAKISFYETRIEEVEKTRVIETIEKQEQIIPSEYDEYGNIIKEETVEVIEIPVTKEETYTEEIEVNYYQLVELPKPSLDELKLTKREEINAARDATEQGGFEYLGKVFDSDPISCQRISCAAQAMALAPSGSTITWTCQDNTTIALNAEQLVGLVAALAQWSNTCHEKATKLKEQIEACQTAEELEKITWEEDA